MDFSTHSTFVTARASKHKDKLLLSGMWRRVVWWKLAACEKHVAYIPNVILPRWWKKDVSSNHWELSIIVHDVASANAVCFVVRVAREVGGVEVGWGTALRARWSRIRFPLDSLEFFLLNPSGRTIALEWIHPLTEMRTRDVPQGIKTAGE